MTKKCRAMSLWTSLWLCIIVLINQSVRAQAPDKLVETAARNLAQAIMADRVRVRQDSKVIAELIEQHMIPIIDQELFAKLSLGKTHWNSASEKQKQDFIQGFKKMLIKSYAGAFKAYNGEEMTFDAPKYNKTNTKVLVRSQIHPKGNDPIEVRYMLYKKDDAWLIYDAIVEGLDLVKTYRSQLNEQIAKEGLDKTIADLKRTQI